MSRGEFQDELLRCANGEGFKSEPDIENVEINQQRMLTGVPCTNALSRFKGVEE